MSTFYSKSSASAAIASFDDMIQHFGVVTVMNAKVFKRPLYGDAEGSTTIIPAADLKTYKAHDILKALLQEAQDTTKYTQIDTLKIANINMEGPTKTVTGGQYVNPLIKFGKTATIEMQDALGRADVIEALGGGIVEKFKVNDQGIADGYSNVLHLTQDFAGAKTILGESFFIDQKTGAQVLVYVLLYEMLPDSIFNLTQDAEGDATVFDLNGSLSAVDILISNNPTEEIIGGVVKGTFYSVLPQNVSYVEPTPPTTYTITYVAAAESGAPQSTIDALNLGDNSVEAGSDWVAPTITGLVFDPSEVTAIAADTSVSVAEE